MTFRPIGCNVLVMFRQGEWRKEDEDGWIGHAGLAGEGVRMDGLVVSVGDRVTAVKTGETVYGDPRRGRVLVIDDIMYHIMRERDLQAKSI